MRKHRFGSMDALSVAAAAEGVEQSRALSQSLSIVPTSSQPNHKRQKSATLGGRNLSPSTHSNDSGVSVSSQEAVCQTCGMPHDILVIPLQGRTEPMFEEFSVMSERKVGGALWVWRVGPLGTSHEVICSPCWFLWQFPVHEGHAEAYRGVGGADRGGRRC